VVRKVEHRVSGREVSGPVGPEPPASIGRRVGWQRGRSGCDVEAGALPSLFMAS